jgi:hypothetical protein
MGERDEKWRKGRPVPKETNLQHQNFFWTLSRLDRELDPDKSAIGALRRDVLPRYEEYIKEVVQRFGWIAVCELPYWIVGNIEGLSDEENLELSEAWLRCLSYFIDWAHAFSLNVDWVAKCAVVTVHRMMEDPTLDSMVVTDFHVEVRDRPQFLAELPGWDVINETRAEAKARLTRTCKTLIDAHIQLVTILEQERGWSPPPPSRQSQHMEWLVRWQVHRWSKEDVAKHYYVSEEAVKTALRTTARELRLPLRREPRGRRPKRSG